MREFSSLLSRLRVAMGTFVAIEAEAADEALALQGIDAAFSAILLVQQLMHPTRGTDLAALSACPPGTSLQVHPWTWEVLELCKQLHEASDGIFEPCLAGVATPGVATPGVATPGVATLGRMPDLQLLPNATVITCAPLHIDLGGIAKGYAVDRAVDALRAADCVGGLVNAGGDLAVFGHRSHPIICAGSDAAPILLDLRDAALATSDASASDAHTAARPPEHRGYYDGRSHRPTPSGIATVIAPRAAIADGLTKCLLAMPADTGAVLLERFSARQVCSG